MIDKCIAECDDLALWFHNGEYVVQALELKKKYAPLTPEQQTIYDNPSSIVDMETKEAAIEAAVPTLDEEITKELPKSETEVIADSIMMNTEKEIAAAVAEHKEETTQEEQTAEPARPKDFNTVEMQNELANSMRQILSGMRGSKPAAEPEPIPEAAVAATQEEEPEEEQQMEGQMSIDDILTGAAEEPKQSPVSEAAPAAQVEETQPQDILSAETINLSDSIHREIGDRDLRSYATELAARQREAAAVQIPVPEPVKEPVLKDVPVMNKEKKEKQQPVQEEVQDVQPVQETVQNVQPVQEAVQAVEPEKPAEAAEAAEETPVQTAQQEAEPQQPKIDPMSYVRTGLDEKEKSLLGFWSSIRGMNEQVNEVVTLMMRSILTDKTSSHGNVLLIGDAGNGRTTLALGMAKILGRCKGLQSQKVAKIYAEDLNGKDIAATVNKIAGGILIIEEAGDLSDSAAAQLSMAMDFKTDGLIVFLEDERRYLMDLLGRNPQFAQKFDITLNVPTLTNDELVEFGRYYALQNDCVMDDSAVLTLYDGIGVLQNSEQPVAILDVKEIMDKAIKKANKFSLGKLFSTVSGKRYDAEDRIIIKGKYFGKIK